MRRAAGDIEVHRQQPVGPIMHLLVAGIRASGNGARSNRNDQLGSRRCFIGFLQRLAHIFRDRTGDQQSVGMSGRGHELDAASPQVPRSTNVTARWL